MEKETIIFKASIHRFLMIHFSSSIIISTISFITYGSIDSSIAFMIAVILSGALAIFLIDYRKKNIVFHSSGIEGPIRKRLSDYRISIPYEKIDLSMCARPSILKNGIIASIDGKRILIYSLYFGQNTVDQLFMKIEEKTNNRFHTDAATPRR